MRGNGDSISSSKSYPKRSILILAYLNLLRVNWIHAITTFTLWKNAITKTQLGKMPLQLLHTSKNAILVI
jgi:hypothetical protein